MTANNPVSKQGPQQIDRYIVVEPIGRGAMGVVYRARDEAVGRDVAIKLLVADLEDEPDIRTRFIREAETTARLTHPNIITIFDIGEDHGRLYIVMELLRGETLKDYLRGNEAMPLARKIDLMMMLCAGLGAAHRAGVYHRDIKPGNIFIRTDGILKILDFGIARLASSAMTRAGFILGTPDYMSPEQARGGTVDARSDIFSVGSVLYFMLSGRKPFAATDLPTIFRQVESQDPSPLTAAEAPPELVRVLMKAMSKNPALRHQSCQELMTELVAVRRQYAGEARRSQAAGRSVAETDTDAAGTRTDTLKTAQSGTLKTAQTDAPKTAQTDTLKSAQTDTLKTAQTDNLKTAQTDNLKTAQTDNLKTAHTDNLKTAHADNLTTAEVHRSEAREMAASQGPVASQGLPKSTGPAKPPAPAKSMGPAKADNTVDRVAPPPRPSDDTVRLPEPPVGFAEHASAFFSAVMGHIRRTGEQIRTEYARRQALRRKR